MRVTLPARQPFVLSSVLQSHGWIRLAPNGTDGTLSLLTRVERLESGRVVEILVREAAGGVSIASESGLTAADQNEIVRKTEWMLELDQDLASFYDLARQEPKLAQMEKTAQGRILRSPTLFEDTVKTILTTNTAWSGTIRMAAKLVGRFGSRLPTDPERRAFPTPDQLADSDEATLRGDAGLGYRAPYVLQLARDVAAGALDLESLRATEIPSAEVRKRLLAIKGVGEYAAANLLMILGRYDWIPVDSWALKMVSHEWHDGEPVGRDEVERAFEQWGEWQGLAFWCWDWSYRGSG
jgi:3-methyladenine DNA glycosylase/8-oxoguanine DNA glycosylase